MSTHFRVAESKHEKMKSIAKKRGYKIQEVYDEAIDTYIESASQQIINRDSGIESYINKRITSAENHLASMLGRTGMDTSMVFMGLVMLLERITNEDRESLIRKLRVEGARYFSTAIKQDKERNKK